MTTFNNYKQTHFFIQVALTDVLLNNSLNLPASEFYISGILFCGLLPSLRILCLIFTWVLVSNSRLYQN